MEQKAIIMDAHGVGRAIARISYEIIEHNHGAEKLCLVGIVTGGVHLSARIAHKIEEIEHIPVDYAPLDITPYRDDLSDNAPAHTILPLGFSVQDKRVILVDDVLYTGRSARAAIDAIFALGRPSSIQFAVLIDRGHRELPIRPDYVGKNVPTSLNETVRVHLEERDGRDAAIIYQNT